MTIHKHDRTPRPWEVDLLTAEEQVVESARQLVLALCHPALVDQGWAVQVAAEALVVVAGREPAAAIGDLISQASRRGGSPTGARLYAASLLTGGHRVEGRYPTSRILEHLAIHDAAQRLLNRLPVSTEGDERSAA